MCKTLWKYMLLAALVFAPAICSAQAKIYTKKNKIASIPTCTTLMVQSGNALLDARFKEEVASRWHLNPFEFCDVAQYEKRKTDYNCCLLRFTTSEGICFLTLTKGGKEEDSDQLKQPVDIVSIPIGNAELSFGTELDYMGDFLSIIQAFTESALESDNVNLLGLKYCNTRSMAGLNTKTIQIIPSSGGKYKYSIIINTDTGELLRFHKSRYNAE